MTKSRKTKIVAVFLLLAVVTLGLALIGMGEVGRPSADETTAAYVGATAYTDLQTALNAARDGSDKNVVVAKGEVSAEGEIEVPSGVNLILPYKDDGSGKGSSTYTEDGQDGTYMLAWHNGKTVFSTLTIGGKLTVRGNLYVGAVVNSTAQDYSGGTTGDYAQLVNNGEISVENGGKVDIYGLVTGTGSIAVKEGAKLYQPFVVNDYTGGNNSKDLYDHKQAPFNRFSVVNVQCEQGITVEYGGELYGHAMLYALSTQHKTDIKLFSHVASADEAVSKTPGLIELTEAGSSATVVYTEPTESGTAPGDKSVGGGAGGTQYIGRTKLTLKGGARANYMSLTIKFFIFDQSVSTKDIDGFPIPYNFDVRLEKGTGSGNFALKCNFKVMPGASLTVGEGATLDLREGNLLVYDGLVQSKMSKKAYPTAAELKAAGYTSNGTLIVNGTLNVPSGRTFLGVVQTTNTSGAAKIVIDAGATIAATITDGATVEYDCNICTYESSARVWDAVNQKLCELEVGRSYQSSYTGDETFSIPQTTVHYESANFGDKKQMENHKDHATSETYIEGKTDAVEGLSGAWMAVHDHHVCDWTPRDGETDFEGNHRESEERRCSELGCGVKEVRQLLKTDVLDFGNETYKGAEFSALELLEKLYEGVGDAGAEFEITENSVIKDAGDYTIKVTLTKGSFVQDGQFVDSATFTFRVDKKDLTFTVKDQNWAIYSGLAQEARKDPNVDYELSGVCGEDEIGFTFNLSEEAKKVGTYSLTVDLTGDAALTNKNYNITPSYTQGDHSEFVIGKATLKAKVNGSTPKGDPLKYTLTVTGYVQGEGNLLDENGNWLEHFTVLPNGFTKDSEPNTYTLTVTYKEDAELENYTVECESEGSYILLASIYKDITFDEEEVVYDGTEHTFGAKNAEGFTVQYHYEDGDHGEPIKKRNVGTWQVQVTISSEGHESMVVEKTFKITARDVTVEILPQGKTYDGENAAATSVYGTDWKFAEGSSIGAGDDVSSLNIVLSVGNFKNAGDYDITAESNAGENYKVHFTSGTKKYKIARKEIDVTVKSVVTAYGESIELSKTGLEYAADALIAGDSISVTLDISGVSRGKGVYDIKGTVDADDKANNLNYTIRLTQGKWTVNAKQISVEVERVTVPYSDDVAPRAPTWSLAAGTELPYGETEDDLLITLSRIGESADAGVYSVSATCGNGNYAVDFSELENIYTIEKLDVGAKATFSLMIDEQTYSGEHFTYTGFTGGEKEVGALVILTVKGQAKQLAVTVEPAKLVKLGAASIVVSVNEKNYSGTKTFLVTVEGANGYTERLDETLAWLREHVGSLTADTIDADDFGVLRETASRLGALETREYEAAKSELDGYKSLVDAWNGAAEAGEDEVVQTAKKVADAALGGLIGAAALTALAALAFVMGKGGLV